VKQEVSALLIDDYGQAVIPAGLQVDAGEL
jgi:hypothetical protein